MQLTEHRPGAHNQILGIEPGRVRVGADWHARSLVVGAHYLNPDWPVQRLDELNEDHLASLLELKPELVIIGAGPPQQFLSPELQIAFIGKGIGVECMTLDAAARTFNVLMSEDRRALAALIIEPAGNPGG